MFISLLCDLESGHKLKEITTNVSGIFGSAVSVWGLAAAASLDWETVIWCQPCGTWGWPAVEGREGGSQDCLPRRGSSGLGVDLGIISLSETSLLPVHPLESPLKNKNVTFYLMHYTDPSYDLCK